MIFGFLLDLSPCSPFRFFGGYQCQRSGEVFVEGEEVFYALAVGGEGVFAVAAVHGAVEGLVGFGEGGRHGHGIIEIRKGAGGEFLARGEDFFRALFDFGSLRFRRCRGPGEVVVHQACRVTVIRFQS